MYITADDIKNEISFYYPIDNRFIDKKIGLIRAYFIRSNHIKNQFLLYALTKLKFSKHHSYFKYLLILSGDINLHPGPVKYPCSVCAKLVRKRIISCEKCGLSIHKNVTLPLSSKITLQVFVNHVKINHMTI